VVLNRLREPALRALVSFGAVIVAGCGWLPADAPATTPAPAHPDAALLHAWKVTDHVLGTRALISAYDATGFHGRAVTVSDAGYVSPWSGSCDQARRAKAPRVAAEIAIEHDIAATEAASLGLAAPILEYELTCLAGTAPGLTLYVAGSRAVTCWAGVCYLLAR
jgi:hypothetical protein